MDTAGHKTTKTLEEEAREAALDYEQRRIEFVCEHRVTTPVVIQLFSDGYIAAANAREEKLRELRLLAEEQLTMLRRLKAEMLADTRDKEIASLRARVKELEEALVKASKLFPVVPPIPLPEGESEPNGQDTDR